MKCQNLFSGKNQKRYFEMFSAEIFTQSAKHYGLTTSILNLNISRLYNIIYFCRKVGFDIS